MKIIAQLLALACLAALMGCRTAQPRRDFSGAPARDFLVTVSCNDSSMKFTGTIISDGHAEQVSGTGSGSFPTKGHEINCLFKKIGARGRLVLEIFEGGRSLGSSSTSLDSGGVRAEILRMPDRQHTLFTTFK